MTERTAKIGLATPENQRDLARRYRAEGRAARAAGKPRDDCQLNGLVRQWWLEGWDGRQPDDAHPLAGD